jgi:hypothetical protein
MQSFGSSVTHSAPESHQFNPELRPEERTPLMPSQHPHPLQESPPEIKRQRTREEEERAKHVDDADDEVNVVIFDDNENNENTVSLKDTWSTEGSRHLPVEVESKLTLQEKVISPSGMLQSRSRTSRHQLGPIIPKKNGTTAATSSIETKLNTSAEAACLSGLAALSTAAFLRLDEG